MILPSPTPRPRLSVRLLQRVKSDAIVLLFLRRCTRTYSPSALTFRGLPTTPGVGRSRGRSRRPPARGTPNLRPRPRCPRRLRRAAAPLRAGAAPGRVVRRNSAQPFPATAPTALCLHERGTERGRKARKGTGAAGTYLLPLSLGCPAW